MVDMDADAAVRPGLTVTATRTAATDPAKASANATRSADPDAGTAVAIAAGRRIAASGATGAAVTSLRRAQAHDGDAARWAGFGAGVRAGV